MITKIQSLINIELEENKESLLQGKAVIIEILEEENPSNISSVNSKLAHYLHKIYREEKSEYKIDLERLNLGPKSVYRLIFQKRTEQNEIN